MADVPTWALVLFWFGCAASAFQPRLVGLIGAGVTAYMIGRRFVE